jgi:hypothetical protein
MIKLLGIEHKDDLKRITISHDKHAGVTTSQANAENFWSEGNFSNLFLEPTNSTHLCWGYFDNGVLISYLNMQLSTTRPVWYLQKVVSDADIESTVPMKGIAELMSHAINFAESKHLFEYYSSIPVVYIRAHERIWGSLVPERKRYDINFDHVVPALQKPAYEEFWVVMMKASLWPKDMVIRHHILRQEHRPDVSVLKQLYKPGYKND